LFVLVKQLLGQVYLTSHHIAFFLSRRHGQLHL